MDVASGIDRHPDRFFFKFYCRYRVIESSSLVSVLLEKCLANPTSFFPFISKCFLCY